MLLAAEGMTKRFGGVAALIDADVELDAAGVAWRCSSVSAILGVSAASDRVAVSA